MSSYLETMTNLSRACVLAVLGGSLGPGFALAQTLAPAAAAPAQGPAARPAAPTRDPKTPGYVTATNATDLPDGAVPPVDANGNFVLGPTHPAAPEMADQDGVPHGIVHTLHDGFERPARSIRASPARPGRVRSSTRPTRRS